MQRNRRMGGTIGPKTYTSRFRNAGKHEEIFEIRKLPLGQIDSKHGPCPDESVNTLTGSPLGDPLYIEDVAAFLGCSPWTVRQKYMPQGLPHLRASLSGKFVFFQHQVVNWILERQARHRKGGRSVSLFKRGTVYWSYVCVEGVRYARSTGTGNRRRAEAIDQHHKDEIRLRAMQFPELNPTMRFIELAGKFLGAGSAKAWHRERLKEILPYFADFQIGKITKGAIRQYRQERHRKKQLTETTVNRDIECLRHLLYWAVDEGLLAANPIARIRLERERRIKKPVLSLAEETLLLPAASSHLQNITIVALDTGMRRGEILAFNKRHATGSISIT